MGSGRNFIGSGTPAVPESDVGNGLGTATVTVELPEAVARKAAAKGEEKDPNSSVIVVDKHGRGNFKSIGKAISIAIPGTLIHVMSGTYRGSLRIKKDDITTIGIGDVTVVSSGFAAIRSISMRTRGLSKI
jgi:pectin methylesterase-like acyl-CoA thioesterase